MHVVNFARRRGHLKPVEGQPNMGIRNFIALLAALVATTTVSSKVFAQFDYQEPMEGRWTPFIEPDTFNPDYQYFAPVDEDTYGGWPDPPTGFFFSYERLYWSVTRSEYLVPEFEPEQGDFTWGNRYEAGFMTEDGPHGPYGWLLSVVHLDGPNVRFIRDITPLPAPVPPNRVILDQSVNEAKLNSVELARM